MQAPATHVEPALHISNLPGNYFINFPRAALAHIFNFFPNRSVLQRVCKPFNRLIKTTPANKLFINITEHTDIEMISKMIANSRSPKVTILVNGKNEQDLSALFHQIDERSNQHVKKLCVSTVAIEKISNTDAFLSKICIFFPNLTDLTFNSELNLHDIHNICTAYPNLQYLEVQNLTEDAVQAITTKRSDLGTLPLPNLKTLIVEYIDGSYLIPTDLVRFQETLLDSSNQITLISAEKHELQQPLNFLIPLTKSSQDLSQIKTIICPADPINHLGDILRETNWKALPKLRELSMTFNLIEIFNTQIGLCNKHLDMIQTLTISTTGNDDASISNEQIQHLINIFPKLRYIDIEHTVEIIGEQTSDMLRKKVSHYKLKI